MKISMIVKLASAAAAIALSAPAMAAPIVYTFTGTFSGTNGGPYSGVDATFTGLADTSTVTFNGYSYNTPLTSLQAVSPTAGVFNITDPSFFYINIGGYAGLEFGAFNDTQYFSGNSNALLGYDGKHSVGTTPINYFSGINATFNTDRGSVTITDAINGTFAAASAVPEPASWAMMIGGFGVVGFAMRTRKRTVATVTYA